MAVRRAEEDFIVDLLIITVGIDSGDLVSESGCLVCTSRGAQASTRIPMSLGAWVGHQRGPCSSFPRILQPCEFLMSVSKNGRGKALRYE